MTPKAINNIKQNNKVVNESQREREAERSLSLVVGVKKSNYNSLYRDLSSDADRSKREKYRKQLAYVIAITDSKANPQTYIVVKSFLTLKKILKSNDNVLLYPYPITFPKNFWNEYRRARTGKERIELIKKYELLKEKSIFILDKIVLDIDSDYDENIQKVKEILSLVNVKAHLFKTKSSRIRIIIPVCRNKKYLTPHGKNKNGRTHLENLKEIVYIFNELFRKFGLNADNSFKYINHPIWLRYEGRDGLVYVETVNSQQNDMFYDVYSKLKAVQRGYRLYPKKEKEKNKKKKEKTELPAFVLNRVGEKLVIDIYEKAVRTLIAKNTSYTYINVIQPATGWAKWLGIEHEAERILLKLLGERKKKDIEKGFKYAKEIEFKLFKRRYDVKEYTDKMLDYLSKKGTATRQELLKEVFCNQKWLTDLVISELEKQNIVRVDTVKHGRGRPAKVVYLNLDYFSQYDNSFQEQCNGLVVDGLASEDSGIQDRDTEIDREIQKDADTGLKDIGTKQVKQIKQTKQVKQIKQTKQAKQITKQTTKQTKNLSKIKPATKPNPYPEPKELAVGRSDEFSRIIDPDPEPENFSHIIDPVPEPNPDPKEFSHIIDPEEEKLKLLTEKIYRKRLSGGQAGKDDDIVDF